MTARLGNFLFWTIMLLAALWFSTVLLPGQGPKNDVTANIMGGLMVLIGLVLRYILSREEAKHHTPSDERVSVDPAPDAMTGHQEPTTAINEVFDKLDAFELRIQQIEAPLTADGISKSNAAALYNRAIALDAVG